jgi:hypothetical protein
MRMVGRLMMAKKLTHSGLFMTSKGKHSISTRVGARPVPMPYSPPLAPAALLSRDDSKAAIHAMLKESL